MANHKIIISVIIPFIKTNPYVEQCLNFLKKQSFKNFEIILLPDSATGPLGPAQKRDLAAKRANGEILAFIDDDAYPSKDWLKSALDCFQEKDVAAVCGPGVTPPDDNIFQRSGGWVNSLWFGSGGAGTYRFIPQKRRLVDDYPSMNFLIRKTDFNSVGGFDTHFWPGEDTKLCLDLVYKLKKKIIYHPQVLVYHHRKPLFLPHLQQISRFAVHRGHFARILPATSLRFGYLIPTLFVMFVLFGYIISLLYNPLLPVYLVIIVLYLCILTANIVYVMLKTGSILVSVLTGSGILLTHILYGILFPYGYLKKSLKQ